MYGGDKTFVELGEDVSGATSPEHSVIRNMHRRLISEHASVDQLCSCQMDGSFPTPLHAK